MLLIYRPVTWDQIDNLKSDGVYDLASQTILYGDDVCTETIQDTYGVAAAADPSIRGTTCYFGGQSDYDGNECNALDIDSRRFCPCLTTSIPPTPLPTASSAWPTTSSPSTTLPTTQSSSTALPTYEEEIRTEAPSVLPSLSPSTNYVITVDTPLHVPYYSASNTNYALFNTVPYTFTVCSAGDIHISDCDPNRCQGGTNDQYIRLFSNGMQVEYNDDSCSYCSAINYPVVSDTCQTYTLQQGCYSDGKCSGSFIITLSSSPTKTPTSLPISQSPSTNLVVSFSKFYYFEHF